MDGQLAHELAKRNTQAMRSEDENSDVTEEEQMETGATQVDGGIHCAMRHTQCASTVEWQDC